jgi:predicted phage baseplate assembly protein
VADAVPAIKLAGSDGTAWTCRQDLLSSAPQATDFVAEVDDLARTTLRFGDGSTHGAMPRAGIGYSAASRVGNGRAGNIAAGSLGHIVATDPGLAGVSNPLPASGGTDPETSEHVRMTAPVAYRTQARAVTEADYAAIAGQYPDPANPEVTQAVATFRWTGSWHTVFVTVERAGGLAVDGTFAACVRAFLEQYRMAGHDVVVQGPVYVPLELDMTVFVATEYFAADVEQAVRAVFTNGRQPNGQPGLFAPANFSFGQTVYASPFLAAAQAINGVDYAEITVFGRWGDTSQTALEAGQLTLGTLELPQLDNDPSLPDRGVFVLTMCGGK